MKALLAIQAHQFGLHLYRQTFSSVAGQSSFPPPFWQLNLHDSPETLGPKFAFLALSTWNLTAVSAQLPPPLASASFCRSLPLPLSRFLTVQGFRAFLRETLLFSLISEVSLTGDSPFPSLMLGTLYKRASPPLHVFARDYFFFKAESGRL